MDPNLSPFMQDLIQTHSLKEDTTKDYKRYWASCYEFFRAQVPPIYPPYSGYNIMMYMEFLCHKKVGKTTPNKILRAINWVHQTQNWPIPGQGNQEMQISRAVRAVQSILPNKGAAARNPLTREEKTKIIQYALHQIKSKGDHWHRNAVILQYAISCGGRMQDLVRLKEKEVKWVLEPALGVKAFFKSTKTDLINKGNWELEYAYQDVDDPLDGVLALLTFMKHNMSKENRVEPNDAYIFKAFQSQTHIAEGTIYGIIKSICTAQGIDSTHIGTHSFRKTCATERHENGATIAEVGRRLGHVEKSDCTTRYIDMSRRHSKFSH